MRQMGHAYARTRARGLTGHATELTGHAYARARHRRKNSVGGKVHDTSWHPVFLETLGRTGNIREACAAAGISPQAAYEHKATLPPFTKQWLEAQADGVDKERRERWDARAARLRVVHPNVSSKQWHARFLEALTDRWNVRLACEAAGVSAELAQKHLARFPDFLRRAHKIMALHLLIEKFDPTHQVEVDAIPGLRQQESPGSGDSGDRPHAELIP